MDQTYFSEPGREGQSLISSQRPCLTRSSGQCVERSTDTENEGNARHCHSSGLAVRTRHEDLWNMSAVVEGSLVVVDVSGTYVHEGEGTC